METIKQTLILVMGVSGCGKTTLARALADELQCRFVDADEHHCVENKRKMRAGIPLDETDRLPWLRTLVSLLDEGESQAQSIVLACSALRQSYRDMLNFPSTGRALLHLKVPELELRSRLQLRRGHFAGADLLTSQLAILETPGSIYEVDSQRLFPDTIKKALRCLKDQGVL